MKQILLAVISLAVQLLLRRDINDRRPRKLEAPTRQIHLSKKDSFFSLFLFFWQSRLG